MGNGRFSPKAKQDRRAFLGQITSWGLSTAILSSIPEQVIAFTAPRLSRAKRVLNQLWAWGNGANGRAGSGATADVTTATAVTNGGLITAVSGGYDHSLLIKNAGTLWAFGNGGSGQMGQSGTGSASTQIQIGTDTNWKSIAAGKSFSLAVRTDNTLWSWGTNARGQMGDGTVLGKSSPVKIGADTTWNLVSAGGTHSLAIKTDGTLWAWGDAKNAQLGDGTYLAKSSPIQIGSDTAWVKVVAGANHSVALKSNGTLWAWGFTESCQVGAVNVSPKLVSSETAWTVVTNRIDAPATFLVGGGMAIKTGGTMWAWGSNIYGELGDLSVITKESPVQIGVADWVTVSASAYHSVGIKTGGTLWAWGGNGDGQLGIGNTSLRSSPIRVGAATTDWAQVSAGAYNTAAIKTTGTLWIWGYGTDGVNGQNNFTSYSSPMQVGTATAWTSISLGGDFAVGLQTGGSLWTWGDNSKGQMGTNAPFGVLPAQMGANTWTKAIAGTRHALAIRSDGTLWAWGDNGNGQLGIGLAASFKSSPHQVGSAATWVDISAASGDSYGVRSDGTLWAWGWAQADWPMLGNGQTGTFNTPQQIPGTTWSKVFAGFSGALAQKTDGTLWTWGVPLLGAAMGSTTTPVQIGTATDWSDISAGDSHTTATKTNGTLYSWGADLALDFQTEFFNATTIPTKIGTVSTWTAVTSGARFNVALRTNNSAWGWGANSDGQLGLGSTSFQSNPTQLSGTSWALVSAGATHVIAKKT